MQTHPVSQSPTSQHRYTPQPQQSRCSHQPEAYPHPHRRWHRSSSRNGCPYHHQQQPWHQKPACHPDPSPNQTKNPASQQPGHPGTMQTHPVSQSPTSQHRYTPQPQQSRCSHQPEAYPHPHRRWHRSSSRNGCPYHHQQQPWHQKPACHPDPSPNQTKNPASQQPRRIRDPVVGFPKSLRRCPAES